MNDNLKLWRSVERTDPDWTKGFSGKGGFKGTAISPMYLIHKATELWGPMGDQWGIDVVHEYVQDGAPGEKLHIVRCRLWFPGTNGRAHIECFGQTMLCGIRGTGDKGYAYTDEEAPKKSLTDALTKGLSWLGFAADVHMGLFDDVKYVERVRKEFDEEERQKNGSAKHREAGLKILETALPKGLEAMELAWKSLSTDMRKACLNDLPGLKQRAAKEHANA